MANGRSVVRWVMIDNQGRYSTDEHGTSFCDELEEAYVFIGRPTPTVAVRAARVRVILLD